MQKVALVCPHADWANVGYEYAKALKSVGVPSVMVFCGKHGFMYPRTGISVNHPLDIVPYIRSADIVIFMHSSYLPFPELCKDKKLVVFHGGTAYRQNSDHLNKFFVEKGVKLAIIQTPDLLGKGPIPEVHIYPPIDLELLQPVPGPSGDVPVICHRPSNQWKGSNMILDVLRSLRSNGYKFVEDIAGATQKWEDHIKHISKCDIYIDGICPSQNGIPYGEWGVAALEAAALGKCVITHGSHSIKTPPTWRVNDRHSLTFHLKTLLTDRDILEKNKMYARDYVEKNHTYKKIGGDLKNALGI